ncbi:MAG: TIGR03986 family CRISPR-associated RAMP protein [wastewater metagenome]|nr:TIGR03986 family CRISPR-associated RAMP protein [Candidatus Loosdrechtia aerotolerans]
MEKAKIEKAKLDISKNNKGRFVVKAVFANNSQMTVPMKDYPDIASLNGKEVDVERINGQIEKVIYNGETVYSKSQTPPQTHIQNSQRRNPQTRNANLPRSTHTQNNRAMNVLEPADAPYNFVPLNDRVVGAEPIPDFNTYHHNKYTGYIDLTIETKTHLYIRDTLTAAEMKKKEELERDEKKKYKYINPDFFSPAGKIRIPGSSLRGMIRNLVEMVSYGKFGFFEKDRKYHFRSFADRSLDLRDKYANKMLYGNRQTGFSQNVSAGYLIKNGTEYKIKPAQVIGGSQFFRVEEDMVISKKILSERMNKKITDKDKTGKTIIKYEDNKNYQVTFKKIRFTYNAPQIHNKHSVPMYYAEITDICNENQSLQNSIEGTLVCSGWMRGPRGRNNGRGKHLHWVIGPAMNTEIEFSPGVIEDYKNDANRHGDANLLRYFKDNKRKEIPCFYREENGRVKSFGHTGLFRLAYDKKLNDFLPKEMQKFQNDRKTDITEAIFGNETTFAGRVFFEDANLCESQSNILMNESIPQVLSTPKPTTFQHYLDQKQSKITQKFNRAGEFSGYNGIKDYNDDTLIRGNKLYWHKTGNVWQETEISLSNADFQQILQQNQKIKTDFDNAITDDDKGHKKIVNLEKLPKDLKPVILKAIGICETQHTKITPVNSGKTFTGKIRFENLSDVELGALLFALELPLNCCHKLGMGKPIGLGSVKITPTLILSNRKTRYTDLFAEWPLKESAFPDKNNEHFKESFAVYILKSIGQKIKEEPVNWLRLWEMDRMKELKTMLDFERKPADEKTQYMQIKNKNNMNEFKERKVLPGPTAVCPL